LVSSYAGSLKSAFDQVLEFRGETANSRQFRGQLESFIATFEQNAVRTADFIATAATPRFAYVYDPEVGTFKRTDISLGPVYVEPAVTVGAGKIGLVMAYLYSNFTSLNGESLQDAFDYEAHRGEDALRVRTSTLDFTSQVFSFSGTYGITNRWDVNLLVPVFLTSLDLAGKTRLFIPGGADFITPFDTSDTKLGIGDILLRTKYRLPSLFGLDMASALTLRLPSGNPDNFQGVGDVTLTPLFIAQRSFGPHTVYANLGIEVDATDVSQTRGRYAVGATILLFQPLTLFSHIIGSSGFEDTSFQTEGIRGVVPRTDIIDSVVGLEFTITNQIVAHIAVIVPLNDDGLRANAVPAAGIETRF